MHTALRVMLLLTAATLIGAPSLSARGSCAPYISGWYHGSPATGYLVGESMVTLETGFDFYLNGSITEEFCVGTYNMLGRRDRSFRLQLRCDTYSIWGLF